MNTIVNKNNEILSLSYKCFIISSPFDDDDDDDDDDLCICMLIYIYDIYIYV